jgi:LPXTG-motif cell wall-anchored protein
VVKGGHIDVDVLANDSDSNPGQKLTVASVGQPAHGRATVTADGRIRYTPAAGWTGVDRFDYVLSDGNGGKATGTVAVTVTDGSPVALPDREETPYQRAVTVDVLANDLDPNGEKLTVTTVTQPTDGKVTFTGGRVHYRPANGFSGTVAFTYTVSNGRDTSTSTVTIVVGTPPAVPDKTVTAQPATPVTIALPAVDQHERPVTVVGIGKPGHGTAKLAGGKVEYTPEPGFAGTDSFSYSARDDDGNMAYGTIKVTVAGPNTAPVATDDRTTVKAGKSVVVTVLTGDRDPNEDPIKVTKVSRPRHGAAVLNADGTVTYAPSKTYAGGTDSFTYTISDGRGGTDTATVTVTVAEGAVAGNQLVIKLPKTGADIMSVSAIGLATLLVGAGLFFFGGRLVPVRVMAAGAGERGPGRHRPGKHAFRS